MIFTYLYFGVGDGIRWNDLILTKKVYIVDNTNIRGKEKYKHRHCEYFRLSAYRV